LLLLDANYFTLREPETDPLIKSFIGWGVER
jgi:hypothetical protein